MVSGRDSRTGRSRARACSAQPRRSVTATGLILFVQGTPVPLRRALNGHQIVTAFEQGWGALQNGELLRAAEAAGFAAIVTTDQNLRYQQNLASRQLAIVVLLTTDWRLIRQHTRSVEAAVDKLTAGSYVELPFPP